MKRVLFFLTIILSSLNLSAQSPKRELRSAWLATVWRIDWPATVITSTGNTAQIQAQKNEMTRILDSLAAVNMNTVYFQVRSRCDAMYNSAYEPWSTDLVSARGMNPGYDPLQFVIEESHKRGLEVHAWLNPYRYESVEGQWSKLPGDYATEHPEWILSYYDKYGSFRIRILDPGRPEVVKRIKNIIGDILQKYDVDGIIFDDYFYAYGGTVNEDVKSQQLYRPADMSVGDWRRANINKMVAEVYDTIQIVKPYVKFGVSPFGIWTTDQNAANKEGIELPQGISGGNMYAEIYCDPVTWLKQGVVDYVSPQLYWPTTSTGQDYDVLCPWWSNLTNRFNRHFYSSQTLSGLSSSNYAPKKIRMSSDEEINTESLSLIEKAGIQKAAGSVTVSQEEMGLQIQRNRISDINNAAGSVFFSAKPLYTTTGFTNYLRKYQFTQTALTPAIHWKAHPDYGLVNGITLNGTALTWNSVGTNVRYSVYAIPNDKVNISGVFATSQYLLGATYTNGFVIPKNVSLTANTFAVAVLDRYGNEYPPMMINGAGSSPASVNLISPANNEEKTTPFEFSWQAANGIEYYVFEIAKDNSFTDIFYSREMNDTKISTQLIQGLKPNTSYYWRVKCRKANALDGISETRKFTPAAFAVLQPVNFEQNVSVTPTIKWAGVSNNTQYTVDVSSNYLFSAVSIVHTATVKDITSYQTPAKILTPQTTYYVRISANINGELTSTPINTFTTLPAALATPVILSPLNGSSVFGKEIKVTWTQENAKNYRLEMSKSSMFPIRETSFATFSTYTTENTFSSLLPADYYFRLRTEIDAKYSNWSDTIKVTLKDNTRTEEHLKDKLSISVLKNDTKRLMLKITSYEFMQLNLSLIASNGSVLYKKEKIKFNAGENQVTVPVQGVIPGVYFINLGDNNSKITIKIIL